MAATTLGVDTLVEWLEGKGCLFRDKEDFKSKVGQLVGDGSPSLCCIADFDFTLSKYFKQDGVSRADSCHKSLEESNSLLSAEYASGARSLMDKYYPIEIDTSVPEAEKSVLMAEWADKHGLLLIEAGLTRRIVETVVSTAVDEKRLVLRGGVGALFSLLEQQEVPLLVFSAGIEDVLDVALRKGLGVQSLPPNVYEISNKCIFADEDLDAPLREWTQPTLHVLNKRAASFPSHPFFATARRGRPNLILLGDSMGDPKMSTGIEDSCTTILKLGFLNVNVEERTAEFLSEAGYDMAILGDPDNMDIVLAIFQLIVIQLR